MLEKKLLIKNKRKTQRNSISSSSLEMRQSILMNKDMIYFKDDILKEVKNIQQELFDKFNDFSKEIYEKINKTSHDNEEIEEKIEYISKNIDNKIAAFFVDKNINNFEKTISELKDNILTNDIKIQSVREDLKIHKDKYSDIINKNIYYHGLIGPGCKYRDMHQFIDYLNSSLRELTTKINQKGSESKESRRKTDTFLNTINNQISDITFSYKSYMNQSIKDLNSKIKEDLKKLEDELKTSIENNIQYAKEMGIKLEEYNDKFENRVIFENDYSEKNEKAINDIKETNTKLFEMLEDYKKELQEIKDQYNEILNCNKELKNKLNPLNLFYKRNNLNAKNSKKNEDLSNIQKLNINVKKLRNQGTETFSENFVDRNSFLENTVRNGQISHIYLKMTKDKNDLKISQKILRNERLEKFNYLYNDNNQSENCASNRSLDTIKPIYSFINSQNKMTLRTSSSVPKMQNKKMKEENNIESHSSTNLGLFANINKKIKGNNYIKDLKNNGINIKNKENGTKLEQNYINKYKNKNSSIPNDFLHISKNKQKERHNNSKQSIKEKNYFNMSFHKKLNTILEENKYKGYMQKGENDMAFPIKENQKEIIFRNNKSKIKIKNLTAIV